MRQNLSFYFFATFLSFTRRIFSYLKQESKNPFHHSMIKFKYYYLFLLIHKIITVICFIFLLHFNFKLNVN